MFTPLRRAFWVPFLASKGLVSILRQVAIRRFGLGANAMTALTLATDGQIEQITRVVNDAAKKTLKPLDKDAAQRVHARGHELAAGVSRLIAELSITDQYADEVVASSYAYPKGYRIKPIGEQIQTLATLFGLDPAKALAYADNLTELPEGAEGWFAFVRSEALSPNYGEAVEKVLGLIGEQPRSVHELHGELSEQHIRVSARTKEILAVLTEGQEGDILIISAQLGLRHRGKSIRRARETFAGNEFGLTSVIVGCVSLTHPERFQKFDELDPDCSGDEYSPDADGDFSRSLFFYFDGDGLRFDYRWLGNANEYDGTASGFLL